MSGPLGIASGPGAMKAAQFVVIAASAALPNERILTGSASEIVVTDSGAGNAVTLTAGSLIVQTDQANTFTVGPQTIQVPTATQNGLILKTTDDDTTENLFESQDSAGAAKCRFTGDGRFYFDNGAEGGTVGVVNINITQNLPALVIRANAAFQNNPLLQFESAVGNPGFTFYKVHPFVRDDPGQVANLFGTSTNLTNATAALLHIKNRYVLKFNFLGSGKLGVNEAAPGAYLHVTCGAAATPAMIIKGAAAQSENLTEWQKSDDTVYAYVDDVGNAQFGSVEAGALTLGTGAAGIDYTLTFDGETNDGVLTWMEDEAEWRYVDDVAIAVDSKGLFLGGAQDMDLGYDGTDGYLRTDLVAPSDLNLDCGAAKTIELQAVVYEDLQVSINNLARGITAPTDRFYDHGVGAGVAYPVLGFAKNDYVWFDVQTHHAMKLNTILDNHIHFVLPNTTTIGHKFVFQLDVIAAGIDGTWAVPAGSPFTATHTVAANDDTTHRLLEIGDIPSSNTTVSTVYKCKLTRIDGVATEYASEVYLEFSDCHYAKNTMGSRQEGIK